jgi:hypothetical protein
VVCKQRAGVAGARHQEVDMSKRLLSTVLLLTLTLKQRFR